MDAKRPKNDLKTAGKKTADKRSTRKQAEIHPETTRKPHKQPTKYANHCRVSYPDSMYLDARACAHQLGVSIQELQRRAMEAYLAAALAAAKFNHFSNQ